MCSSAEDAGSNGATVIGVVIHVSFLSFRPLPSFPHVITLLLEATGGIDQMEEEDLSLPLSPRGKQEPFGKGGPFMGCRAHLPNQVADGGSQSSG